MVFLLRLLPLLALCLIGLAHGAEKRVALVIGNAAYEGASALRNPVNDARAIAAKLQKIGFDVVHRENLTTKQIGSTLREFRSRLTPGAEALFFYAGHGLQVKGVNYLPAVDADIAAEEDVPTQSIELGKVLEVMEDRKTRLNLVFLDACRNNPFTRRFRSVGGGLARIEAPSGTKISFATRPGSVAADGDGSNGLYTEHLLRVMDERGVAIEQALKKVYSGVKKASKGAQEPWEEGTIEGEFFFQPDQGGAQAASVPAAPPPSVRVQSAEEIEQELWDGIRNSSDPRDFEGYLASYPNGRFAALARQKIKSAVVVAAPSVPAAALAVPQPAPPPAKLSSPPGAGTLTLAKARNCLACHAVDKKIVGPAYRDVARKYAGQDDAEARLFAKVKGGGKGVWGEIPMPPNGSVADEDIKSLVKWILAGAQDFAPDSIRRDAQIKAPEIAENGAVVPVEVAFSPPLRAGDKAQVFVAGNVATTLDVLEGEVGTWSMRVAMPASGFVRIQSSGGGAAQKEIRVTIGADNAAIAALPPLDLAIAKVRTAPGETKMLLSGALAEGRLAISGAGFRVAVSGSPYLARNPYLAFKGSVRDDDRLQLSMLR